MNRHSSPNLSAIEDHAIAQSERAARIRAEMAAEAAERVERLSVAEIQSPHSYLPTTGAPTRHLTADEVRAGRRIARSDDCDSLRVNRDPCPYCGVRADKHGESGCKRWRAA